MESIITAVVLTNYFPIKGLQSMFGNFYGSLHIMVSLATSELNEPDELIFDHEELLMKKNKASYWNVSFIKHHLQ